MHVLTKDKYTKTMTPVQSTRALRVASSYQKAFQRIVLALVPVRPIERTRIYNRREQFGKKPAKQEAIATKIMRENGKKEPDLKHHSMDE